MNNYRFLEMRVNSLGIKKMTQDELSKILNIERNRIQALETSPKVIPKDNELRAYCEYFNTTSDYLLGIRDTKPVNENIAMIGKYTGLSDKALKQLHNFAEERNPKGGNFDFSSHYAMTINTLDVMLSYYYDLYNEKQGFRGSDIFHLMGNYLIADNIELQTPDRFRYRYGNKFDDFKTGEKLITQDGEERILDNFSVIGNDGASFGTDKIYFHEKTNTENRHYLEFTKLYRTHAISEIRETLNKMIEYISQNDVQRISSTKRKD